MVCTPSAAFVNSGYSSTPLFIAIGTAILFLFNVLLILLVCVWLGMRRAVSRGEFLAARNKQNDAALKVLQEAAAISQQANQSKTDFLAFLCHEIRNPLHSIVAMINFLESEEDGPLTQEQREHVETVQASVHSMSAIVNEALDMSKIEAGKLTFEIIPFNIADVMKSITLSEQPRAQLKGLTLKLNMDNSQFPYVVYGDPTRFRQIVINVLSNAVKFTQHGSVTLSVTRLPDVDLPSTLGSPPSSPSPAPPSWTIVHPPSVPSSTSVLHGRSRSMSVNGGVNRLDLEKQQKLFKLEKEKELQKLKENEQEKQTTMIRCMQVQVQISDTGVGIPPEAYVHLFEPYSQAKVSVMRMFGGTGLGLAIAKQLVDQTGGSITLDSEVNKGTTVTIHMPFRLTSNNTPTNTNSQNNNTKPSQSYNNLGKGQGRGLVTSVATGLGLGSKSASYSGSASAGSGMASYSLPLSRAISAPDVGAQPMLFTPFSPPGPATAPALGLVHDRDNDSRLHRHSITQTQTSTSTTHQGPIEPPTQSTTPELEFCRSLDQGALPIMCGFDASCTSSPGPSPAPLPRRLVPTASSSLLLLSAMTSLNSPGQNPTPTTCTQHDVEEHDSFTDPDPGTGRTGATSVCPDSARDVSASAATLELDTDRTPGVHSQPYGRGRAAHSDSDLSVSSSSSPTSPPSPSSGPSIWSPHSPIACPFNIHDDIPTMDGDKDQDKDKATYRERERDTTQAVEMYTCAKPALSPARALSPILTPTLTPNPTPTLPRITDDVTCQAPPVINPDSTLSTPRPDSTDSRADTYTQAAASTTSFVEKSDTPRPTDPALPIPGGTPTAVTHGLCLPSPPKSCPPRSAPSTPALVRRPRLNAAAVTGTTPSTPPCTSLVARKQRSNTIVVPASSSSSSSSSQQQQQKPLNLLVVDDSSANLKILCRMLKGHDLTTAMDGLQALNQVKDLMDNTPTPTPTPTPHSAPATENITGDGSTPVSPRLAPSSPVRRQFDMIFTDIVMPVMDGLSFARECRLLEQQLGLPGCPIVAVTANSFPQDREACSQAGINYFLSKPFQAQDVLQFINTLYQNIDKQQQQPPPPPQKQQPQQQQQNNKTPMPTQSQPP